jgi:hypothetical protein
MAQSKRQDAPRHCGAGSDVERLAAGRLAERDTEVKYPSVTVTALLTAPCEVLFEIVSDPLRHPGLAGSGEVIATRWVTPPPVGVGSAFQSRQCVGWYQYPTRSFVQVYDPPYRFVWMSGPGFRKPPLGQLWGFELKPLDARSTLVSHMMKWPLFPLIPVPPFTWLAALGVNHELANMRPTLFKLARLSGALVIGDLQVAYEWYAGDTPGEQERASVARATPAR